MISITRIRENNPDFINAAAFKRAHGTALYAVGETWKKEILPKTFQKGYGEQKRIQPRSRRYLKRNRNGNPFEFSGELMKAATTQAPKIRVTKTGVSVRLTGLPDYVSQRRVTEDPAIVIERLERHIATLDKLKSLTPAQVDTYDRAVERIRSLRNSYNRTAGTTVDRTIIEGIDKQIEELKQPTAKGNRRWNALGRIRKLQSIKAQLANVGRGAPRYPPILQEIVRTLEPESKQLLKVYDAAARAALMSDPKAKRGMRTKGGA